MPKAENRKKPPNMLGNAPGRGKRNTSDGFTNHVDRQQSIDKKQELLERMKKLQASKKAGADQTE